jgi:hypothetical protein
MFFEEWLEYWDVRSSHPKYGENFDERVKVVKHIWATELAKSNEVFCHYKNQICEQIERYNQFDPSKKFDEIDIEITSNILSLTNQSRDNNVNPVSMLWEVFKLEKVFPYQSGSVFMFCFFLDEDFDFVSKIDEDTVFKNIGMYFILGHNGGFFSKKVFNYFKESVSQKIDLSKLSFEEFSNQVESLIQELDRDYQDLDPEIMLEWWNYS